MAKRDPIWGKCGEKLQCLYSICGLFENSDVTFEQISREVINLLSRAMAYPDITCAEIIFKGQVFRTDNFRDTEWRISSDINTHGSKIGVISVLYLEERPQLDEGPFQKEERMLLNVIAEQLGKAAQVRETQEALKCSENWYRLLADNVSDVIWTTDLNMNFTYFSPSVTRMRGYTVVEAMALKLKDMLPPDSYNTVINVVKEELVIEAKPHKDLNRTRVLEIQEICKGGSTIWIEVKMRFLRERDGKAIGVIGVTRDITERKRAEENIKHLAYYDAVTGLPNRTLLFDRIEMALNYAQRNSLMLAVIMLDLDHFKDVNDQLGHATGDHLLKHVAERLTNTLRKTDTAARIGGDEFVVLLPSIVREEYASTVAKKIVVALRKPFAVDGNEMICTASIGVAIYPHCGKNVRELIKNADIAMYRAKEQGRNRFDVFTDKVLAIEPK